MSKIEVDAIDKQSGSTLTLGGSGTAVTLACGATQSGFGRTGTVDWQTSIKTAASFTAVNGEGYFVDTSSNAVTANLPAGSVGAIVSFKDYAQNFDTNALTISANGSEKIEGLTSDLVLDAEGLATTLVYGDATKGWQSVNSNEVTNTIKFVAATGGTITTSGDFKIHTFTGPGTFQVSCGGNAGGSNTVSYVVVAGGAGGASGVGGGGGAGGFREGKASSDSYTASPLACTSGANAGLPVSVQSYPISVGGGGTGGNSANGNAGSASSFSTITSAGGGGGARNSVGGNGGSGGGGYNPGGSTGKGTGNTPPVSPSQGNPGGDGNSAGAESGGGGGGAGAAGGAGSNNPSSPNTGGPGGNGVTSNITASPVTRAGGGGGSGFSGTGGAGGSGGGADAGPGRNAGAGQNATANTGGGGGSGNYAPGTPSAANGGNAGSGIVIIRYKFQ